VYSGESGEKVNAKVKAAVDSFVEQAQHAAERLQDPAVQANAADYLARLASQVDPAWGEKVRTRTNQWIKTHPEGEPGPANEPGPSTEPGPGTEPGPANEPGPKTFGTDSKTFGTDSKTFGTDSKTFGTDPGPVPPQGSTPQD